MMSIVSLLLEDFYSNPPPTVLTTSKILQTLLKNAISTPHTNTTASDNVHVTDPNPKHAIRLSNPKINKHLVQVPGALDILAMAGFEETIIGDGINAERLLTYMPPKTKGDAITPMASDTDMREHDSHQQTAEEEERTERTALIEAICNGLASKIAELTPAVLAPAAESKSDFLSSQQRQERIAKLKAQKKEATKERELAKQRWAEDMADKKAAAVKREALLNVKRVAQNSKEEGVVNEFGEHVVGYGVNKDGHTIGTQIGGGSDDGERVLPKTFAMPSTRMSNAALFKTHVSGDEASSDPQVLRRQLIQTTMKSMTLSAKEKQAKIQEYMRLDDAALLSMSLSSEPFGTNDGPRAHVGTPFATTSSLKNNDDDMTGSDDSQHCEIASQMDTEDNTALKNGTLDDRKPPPAVPATAPSSSYAAQKQPFASKSQQQPNKNNDFSITNDELQQIRSRREPSTAWTTFLQNTPRCASAEGIRDTSVFSHTNHHGGGTGMVPPKCLRRLFKELDGLKDSLPSDGNCSIWLRFDEETPQYIRALITGPLPGPTPYCGGIFFFDIYVPNDYPNTNPKVQLLTTGGGRVRFGPNLYADGKVCLSLLGTWEGPKWNPKHSSLYQVLISIQGLILGVEHPFYLEPGHGGWEGSVKQGQYQVTGHTLAGRQVKEEVGVPIQVVVYEDTLRVGTVKYCMSQPLRAALEGRDPSLGFNAENGMEAFYDIIQAHFCENNTAILAEVKNWMSDTALGRNRSTLTARKVAPGGAGAISGTLQIDALQGLLPKLEELVTRAVISETCASSIGEVKAPAIATDSTDVSMEVEDDSKLSAQESNGVAGEATKKTPNTESAKRPSASSSGADFVEQKRQKMQSAASQGDFILAGKLQEEVKRLEELQNGIQEAAANGDFIRAGRLQTQFKALTDDGASNATTAGGASKIKAHNQQHSTSAWASSEANMAADDDLSEDYNSEEDYDSEQEMDWDEDDGMDGPGPGGNFPGSGGGMHSFPPHAPHGLGSNVYAPPSSKYHTSHAAAKNWSWGAGQTLSAAPASAPSTSAAAAGTSKVAAARKSIPTNQLCRLRIRLPNEDKSIVEDFNKNDSLAEVYRQLESIIPGDDESSKKKSPFAAPPVPGGAFSQPVSLAGFTLLLTRPKREFSLEMHGTMSLEQLNLAPSATLTVMKCNERGIARRGELDSRLRSAQGDACDVEGLTYEGLMELTEQVGKAAPKDGEAYLNMTAEEFEVNTEAMSPFSYIAALEDSMDDDHACPICLGTYDSSDNTPSLRKLNHCNHTMHLGCLQTWLRTSSSCPLCKVHIVGDGKKKSSV